MHVLTERKRKSVYEESQKTVYCNQWFIYTQTKRNNKNSKVCKKKNIIAG